VRIASLLKLGLLELAPKLKIEAGGADANAFLRHSAPRSRQNL